MEEQATRVRVSYKISAKGFFCPDITSEGPTVEIVMENLQKARNEMTAFAAKNGYKESKEGSE